jgi:DNA polymerase-3 subunit chi
MGLVLFYHLTRSPVVDTARSILQRALKKDWRVMIRGTDRRALEELDAQLWLGPQDDFLPHGMEGGPQDADQPVLIGLGSIGNAAQGLMLVDGAEPAPDELARLDRVWILFDGNHAARLQHARAQWAMLTEAGHSAQYWSEEAGRWEKKAEKVPPSAN